MKRLTMKDQISMEEHREKMLSLSDSKIKQFGYPSRKVLSLSYQLSDIAGKWRRTREDALVDKYKGILYEMILNGYDVRTLPIQDQLPEDLMPELPPENVREAIQREYATEE